MYIQILDKISIKNVYHVLFLVLNEKRVYLSGNKVVVNNVIYRKEVT